MTTQTPEPDTLGILKELTEVGIAPGEELERVTQEVGGEILQKPSGTPGTDDETPAMVSTSSQGAGYTTVYHTQTGLSSEVSNNMMPAQIRKTLNEIDYPGMGTKRAFTIYAPGTPGGPVNSPVEGTLKCYMHKDSPQRATCDEFGFVFCPKDNISSVFDQIEHMTHRHTREWAAFEARREQTERAEDRAIQRGMLEAMQVQAGTEVTVPNGGIEAETVVTADESPVVEIPSGSNPTIFSRTCHKCDHVVTADTEEALSPKMGGHTRKAHPKRKRK